MLFYVMLCLGVLGATHFATVEGGGVVSPVVGGLLVGLSQGVSLLLTQSTLGLSAAYESIGDIIWSLTSSSTHPSYNSIFFALGTTLGTFILSHTASLAQIASADIGHWRGMVGGVFMVVGARLGGGCTSGHGISGMGMLSLSSFLSVIAMFGGGIVSAAFLG